MPADTPRVAGQDQVREALRVVLQLADDAGYAGAVGSLAGALGLEGTEDARAIADALLSRPAPEPRECQHDFAASTETPILGLLPVARCTKCGAGSIDRAPRPAPSDAVLAGVVKAVDDTLAAHRLSHTTDDLGNGLPLVDALTPEGDDNIEIGEYEIEALGLAVADAVVDALAAVSASRAGGGVPCTCAASRVLHERGCLAAQEGR